MCRRDRYLSTAQPQLDVARMQDGPIMPADCHRPGVAMLGPVRRSFCSNCGHDTPHVYRDSVRVCGDCNQPKISDPGTVGTLTASMCQSMAASPLASIDVTPVIDVPPVARAPWH